MVDSNSTVGLSDSAVVPSNSGGVKSAGLLGDSPSGTAGVDPSILSRKSPMGKRVLSEAGEENLKANEALVKLSKPKAIGKRQKATQSELDKITKWISGVREQEGKLEALGGQIVTLSKLQHETPSLFSSIFSTAPITKVLEYREQRAISDKILGLETKSKNLTASLVKQRASVSSNIRNFFNDNNEAGKVKDFVNERMKFWEKKFGTTSKTYLLITALISDDFEVRKQSLNYLAGEWKIPEQGKALLMQASVADDLIYENSLTNAGGLHTSKSSLGSILQRLNLKDGGDARKYREFLTSQGIDVDVVSAALRLQKESVLEIDQLDVRGLDISGEEGELTNLYRVQLKDLQANDATNLSYVNMSRAVIKGEFSGCEIRNSNLDKAQVEGFKLTSFENVNFTGSSLIDTEFSSKKQGKVSFKGVNLNDATIRVDFSNIDLTGVSLAGATLLKGTKGITVETILNLGNIDGLKSEDPVLQKLIVQEQLKQQTERQEQERERQEKERERQEKAEQEEKKFQEEEAKYERVQSNKAEAQYWLGEGYFQGQSMNNAIGIHNHAVFNAIMNGNEKFPVEEYGEDVKYSFNQIKQLITIDQWHKAGYFQEEDGVGVKSKPLYDAMKEAIEAGNDTVTVQEDGEDVEYSFNKIEQGISDAVKKGDRYSIVKEWYEAGYFQGKSDDKGINNPWFYPEIMKHCVLKLGDAFTVKEDGEGVKYSFDDVAALIAKDQQEKKAAAKSEKGGFQGSLQRERSRSQGGGRGGRGGSLTE